MMIVEIDEIVLSFIVFFREAMDGRNVIERSMAGDE